MTVLNETEKTVNPSADVKAKLQKAIAKRGKADTSKKLVEAGKKIVAKTEAIFTPSQAMSTFAENLNSVEKPQFLNLYGDLLQELATEGASKIQTGETLYKLQQLFGERFKLMVKECVETVLRLSYVSCLNRIALYEVFSLKFSKSKTVKTALSRIWGAEGCFDATSGKLSPEVDKAIAALGGIPENANSEDSEVWARKFIREIDMRVKESRKAQPGGRKLDAATLAKKQENIVKAFKAFIARKEVTAVIATKLLTDILVAAIVEMDSGDVNAAFKAAVKEVSEKKMKVKAASESVAASEQVAQGTVAQQQATARAS